jgi:hypothetical protein
MSNNNHFNYSLLDLNITSIFLFDISNYETPINM